MPKVALTQEEAKENISNQQAVRRFMRKMKNPELYIGFTDDLIQMCEKPGSDLRVRFETVFSREQRKNLCLVLHPLLKRWTLFERTWHKGQPLWQVVCIFKDEACEGYLPPDLVRSDNMLEHLRGRFGDFREVTYKDLELVEKCDLKKYGWEGVLKFLAQFDDIEQKEEERILKDRVDDFLDYNFWLAMRDAQAHYSQPWSTRSVELKSDPARYRIEEKNGYKVRTRIYGEEGDLNEMKALVEGRLDDYFDETSASGRAACRVLEIKNKNYYERHGITLLDAARGISKEDSAYAKAAGDSVAEDKINKDEIREMRKQLIGQTLPPRGIALEDWLLDVLA